MPTATQLSRAPCGAPGHARACRRRRLVAAPHAGSAAPTESSPKQAPLPQQQPPAVVLDDSRTKEFMAWARGPSSIRFSGVKPVTFNGLRGLAASKDIAADALLVEVPRRSALVLAPKQRNSAPGLVTDAWWQGAPWFAKMAVQLLWHKRQGAGSPLAPWVAQLPADPGSPVLWTEAQLAALQYPHLVAQVRAQKQEWAELHAQLVASNNAQQPQQQQQQQQKQPISREEFLWAMSVVRSRTFSGPYIGSTLTDRLRLLGLVAVLAVGNTALGGADFAKTASAALAVVIFNVLYEVILSQSLKQYAICPLIDLFNHSSAVQSEVSYNYFGDSYAVVAAREVKQGEQVFISYGAQSNDSLMQFYGFAEPNNPQDVYVIDGGRTLTWLTSFRQVSPARLQALRAAGAPLADSLQQVVVQRAGFPAEALQALRFLLASDAQAATGVGAFAKPGSADAEATLADALVHVVNAELATLGSTLQDDLAALASGPSGKKAAPAEAAALAFRVEKKKVLAAVLRNMGAA